MPVTLFGMTILTKLRQFENVQSPIHGMPSGMTMLVRFAQLQKLPEERSVTLFGMVYAPARVFGQYINVVFCLS